MPGDAALPAGAPGKLAVSSPKPGTKAEGLLIPAAGPEQGVGAQGQEPAGRPEGGGGTGGPARPAALSAEDGE